ASRHRSRGGRSAYGGGWAAGDTWGRRRHLGKEPAALPGRRPSGYWDSSSSVRLRWFFPKTAISTPGSSAHGIVTNMKKLFGAVTLKSAPAIRTPPQAPRWPMPSVQPVPSDRIRVGQLLGMYTYMLHSHQIPPTVASMSQVFAAALLCEEYMPQ